MEFDYQITLVTTLVVQLLNSVLHTLAPLGPKPRLFIYVFLSHSIPALYYSLYGGSCPRTKGIR